MATIGGVSGKNNFSWGYDQVAAQLVKLYKDPGSSGCKALMYESGHDPNFKGMQRKLRAEIT